MLLCFGCESSGIKQIEELNYDVNETLKKLSDLGVDPSIKNSPFHLFSENSKTLSERLISEIGKKDPDKGIIKHNLDFLKNDLITHSINDSLKLLYDNLLGITEIKLTRKSRLKLKISILKAQQMFISEMLNAAIRLQTNAEPLPYIIPVKTELLNNEEMEAFLILPDPVNTRLVFLAPKYLRYDSHRKNFIYMKGEATGDKDSICVEAIIKNRGNQREHLLLSAYFHKKP